MTSRLTDRYTHADEARLQTLQLSGKPEMIPATVRRLAEMVCELQTRVERLEDSRMTRAKKLIRRTVERVFA